MVTQWISEITLVVCAGFGSWAPALAQAPAKLTEAEGTAITWVVAVALVLIVSVTAFINPKRSHHA